MHACTPTALLANFECSDLSPKQAHTAKSFRQVPRVYLCLLFFLFLKRINTLFSEYLLGKVFYFILSQGFTL